MNANFRSYVLQKSSRISETNVTFSQRNPRNSTLKNYRMMHFDKALVVSLGRRKVEESFHSAAFETRVSAWKHTYSWHFAQPHRFVYPREGKRKRKRRKKMCVRGRRGKGWEEDSDLAAPHRMCAHPRANICFLPWYTLIILTSIKTLLFFQQPSQFFSFISRATALVRLLLRWRSGIR